MEEKELNLEFKIGMVAPSKAGKSSLMTAIFHEIKNRLSGNAQGIQYWANSKATQNKISMVLAEFATCTATDDVFEVPRMLSTEESTDYKFTFTVPVEAGTQRLNIDIMDYPGGWLGTPKFNQLRPHMDASSALLVPIPADILMEWKRTHKENSTHSKKINIISQCMLDVQNVISVIKDWATRRANQNEKSLLMFVPVRCEAYFNDNGGSSDKSEILHQAVKELYIDALKLPPEVLNKVQIETHAVDTYGIVELMSIELKEENGKELLDSKFKRRIKFGNEIQAKGALEVLSTIIRFRLNEYAKQIDVEREVLETEIENRSWFASLWDIIFGNPKKKALVEYIKKYDGAFQAMGVVSKLTKEYPARQRVHNKLED